MDRAGERRPRWSPSLRGWLFAAATAGAAGAPPAWSETFDGRALDRARWVPTAEGDFQECVADVVDTRTRGEGDRRLRLRADTRGTSDQTVKHMGVRTAKRFSAREGARFSVELDWNGQSNGSYLSAALVLSPAATARNPQSQDAWLAIEYLGVPPGRNARMAVSLKAPGGSPRTLFAEGWPDLRREGRVIGIQRLEVAVRRRSFQILENGVVVFDSEREPLPFADAHLYLQLSSHSNFPAREVFFDDVRVWIPTAAPPARRR